MDIQSINNQIAEMVISFGPRLLAATAVLIIGSLAIKVIVRGLSKILSKSKLDKTLTPFLTGLAGSLLKVLLVVSALGMIGIEMTSFIAILGAAGLAVGMALSGTLQNFAGGVIILLFRPFKLGDYIDTQGFAGTVKEIQIFNTILTTPDNKTVILPNGKLAGTSLTNFSTQENRRVDWKFGISYGDDVDTAKQLIRRLTGEDSRILIEPEPFIAVSELAESSVNFTVRAWVNAADYWGVFFEMNEKVYKEFNKEGLHIPFPQVDVHLRK